MADGAVHLLGHGVAGAHVRRCATCVALGAGLLGVPRPLQIGLIHEEGNGLSGARDLQVGVAMAALAVAVRHSFCVGELPYFVRLVAVHAGRNQVRLLFPEFAPDDFTVHGLDLPVTLPAGGGDVGFGDGRAWIGVRQNVMGRMAARAYRGNRKPFLVERLAMEAILVVLQDVGLGYVVCQADGGAFAMATAAELRNFHRRGGRVRARWPQNVVSPVATLAVRGHLVAPRRSLPVQTGVVLGLLVGMARATIHRGQLLGMGKLLLGQLTVATGAFQRRVGRSGQTCRIDLRRYSRLPLPAAGANLVASGAFFGARKGFGLDFGLGFGLLREGQPDTNGGAEYRENQQSASAPDAPAKRHEETPATSSFRYLNPNTC